MCNFDSIVGDTSTAAKYSLQGDNPYGCVDMAGNIWEWTRTLWAQYPYDPNDGREDPDVEDDIRRVLRGGAFDNEAKDIRCAYRINNVPTAIGPMIGFRVVVDYRTNDSEAEFMSDALPAYKRRSLENRRSNLIEEYEAISKQLDSTLEAGQRIRLQRQIEDLEQEIAEIDEQLTGRSLSKPMEQSPEPVKGIPTALSSPLRNTLLQCAEFRDSQSLRAVLAHEMLTPWQHSVPIVNAPQSQVSVLISYLADRYRADGQNALVLFLDVLADNYDENDQLHSDLLDLAKNLAAFK
jgi:hypothetical protein